MRTTLKDQLIDKFITCELDCSDWDYAALSELAELVIEVVVKDIRGTEE